MKKNYFFFIALTLIISFCANAQTVNIPDANFKNALLNYDPVIDTNGNGEIEISEAEAVTSINVSDKNISDLTGIEAFVNITGLSCNSNKINAINISNNNKLTSLSIYGNKITEIDISKQTELNYFDCAFNDITDLDISKNTKLTRIRCSYNKLTNLNLANSNNASLSANLANNYNLYCAQVDDVTIAVNADWTKDDILGYSVEDCSTKTTLIISAINGSVTANPASTGGLYTIGESVTLTATPIANYEFRSWYGDINETSNPTTITIDKLTKIEATFNKINDETVNIPDTNFKNALVNYNPVIDTNRDGEIQVSEAEAFNQQLNISNKNISDLTGIEAFVNITYLNFSDNTITQVDVSKNTKILSIDCSDNKLTSLDLSNNIELIDISADSNLIENINVSTLTKLQSIRLRNNKLTSIDVSNNINLTYLGLNFNDELSSLDVTKNTKLNFLDFFNSKLTSVDLNNNTELLRVDFTQSELTSIDVSSLINLDDLRIGDSKISTLDITNNTKLKTLRAYGMDLLTNITFPNNSVLEDVSIGSPKMSEINLSTNTNLKRINLSGNGLLTRVNIANGNNANITDFYLDSYSTATCIQIDSGFTVPSSGWFKGDNASYSDNCTQYTLNTNAVNGTITINPENSNNTYEQDSEVVLTAVPNNGYQFDSWSGDITETTNPITVKMDGNKTIAANFIEVSTIEISTYATGFTSLEGINVNSNNEVYVSEHNSGKIYKLNDNGDKTLIATSGFKANGIAFNNDDKLFIAAPTSGKILEADNNGNLTEYVSAFGDSPYGITFKENIMYYVSETNSKVVKVNTDKTKEDYITDFFTPEDIAFDSNGNAYVTDRNDRKLIKITPSGTKTTVASGYAAIRGVAVANDIVYFTTYSFNTNKIVKYNIATDEVSDYITTNLNEPRDIAIDKLGNMYVTNAGDNTVTKIFDEDLRPEFVEIPDPIFKQILIDRGVDLNNDGEIQFDEAEAYNFVLYMPSKNITSLKGLEAFPNIIQLDCTGNKLTTLNVSKNTKLTELKCDGNEISAIDVSKNIELVTFSCGNNNLSNLDVTNNTKLTYLFSSYNKISSIDITKNTLLEEFYSDDNELTELNISNNIQLEKLYAGFNKINSIDVTNNTQLETIGLTKNELTSIDVTNNTKLVRFLISNNQLSNIDLTNNTLLEELNIFDNKLTDIDVSKNLNLVILSVSENKLTNIDVSKNTNLVNLNIHKNELTSLDVTANNKLTLLNCFENKLTSLDIKNGANNILTTFSAVINPDLTCINVDDKANADSNTQWQKDATASYNEDCSSVASINNVTFSNNLNIYPNPVENILTISSKSHSIIKEIKIVDLLGKEIMITKETSINVSKLPNGVYIMNIVGENNKTAIKKFVKK